MRLVLPFTVSAMLLTVAGCGATTASHNTSTTSSATTATATAATTTAPLPAELPGRDVLGDPSTTRWCALTSTQPLDKVGMVSLGPQLRFTDCGLHVSAEDGANLRVEVGAAGKAPGKPVSAKKAGHGLSIETVKRAPNECVQHVVFADGIRLAVSGRLLNGGYPMDKCEPVTAMTDHVVDYLLANKRPGNITPAEGSLRGADPCKLGDPAVKTVPDLRSLKPTALDKHRCAWTTRAVLIFGVADDFGVHSAPYSLAGRDTTEDRLDDTTCSIKTKHTPNGTDGVETATIQVTADTINAACAQATTIAEALWPTLPAA